MPSIRTDCHSRRTRCHIERHNHANTCPVLSCVKPVLPSRASGATNLSQAHERRREHVEIERKNINKPNLNCSVRTARDTSCTLKRSGARRAVMPRRASHRST